MTIQELQIDKVIMDAEARERRHVRITKGQASEGLRGAEQLEEPEPEIYRGRVQSHLGPEPEIKIEPGHEIEPRIQPGQGMGM